MFSTKCVRIVSNTKLCTVVVWIMSSAEKGFYRFAIGHLARPVRKETDVVNIKLWLDYNSCHETAFASPRCSVWFLSVLRIKQNSRYCFFLQKMSGSIYGEIWNRIKHGVYSIVITKQRENYGLGLTYLGGPSIALLSAVKSQGTFRYNKGRFVQCGV